MKLKDIIKMIAEEKESNFKPISDLESAIKQYEKGSDYYDKTKLRNIFNQLSPEDQKEARKKYSKYL